MKCTVPISAHFAVEGGKITSEEYKTSEMDASKIADLLIEEFGMDLEEVSCVDAAA